MKSSRLPLSVRCAIVLCALAPLACGSDSTPTPVAPVVVAPVLTTVKLSVPAPTISMGQTTPVTASGVDQNGSTIAVGTVTWLSAAPAIASVSDAGVITGLTAGTTTITASAGGKTGQALITVLAPPAIRINEIESNGGTPGDWAELFNTTSAAVDISGWVLKDNDDTHAYAFPAGTTIAAGGYVLAEEAAFGFGLGAPDAVRLFNQFGAAVDSYAWTAHATTTYGRCPNATGDFVTTTTSTKGAANDCSVAVKINEVESNGGTPGDWIELYNAGAAPVNLSGYVLKDNDDTHASVIAAGTTLAAGSYLVVEEDALGFGLGAADAARLFDPAGKLVDSYEWTAHATTTYGRCPNGTGAFATTSSSTKGIANTCAGAPVGTSVSPWPGSDDVVTVDGSNVFGGNLSGLTYEPAAGGVPAVLWAVRNGPGTLYRLLWNGTIWTPDAANGWAAGKALHYTDGTGDPDAEGVTFAETGGAAGMYAATERNNSANTVSRVSVLRFDATSSSTSLNATHEWNLTSDLPVVGANLGIEAVTWIPDAYLVSKGFYDEAAGRAYRPVDYPNHGTGLFFVGLEANGVVYAYALNHANSSFKRIATIATPNAGVMGLEFDRDVGYLWATCDDGCGNRSAILEIDAAPASPTLGRFVVTHQYERPASMPNINNEGFAIAPESECVNGKKFVYWSDDSETNGHAIRRASIPCGRLP